MLLLLKRFKIPTTWSSLEDFLLTFVLKVQTHTIDLEEDGGRDRLLARWLGGWLGGWLEDNQSSKAKARSETQSGHPRGNRVH
jgi:hypothetical protein